MASDVEVLRRMSARARREVAEWYDPRVSPSPTALEARNRAQAEADALSAAISALESLERQAANPPTHQERVHDPARHAWVKPFSDGSDLCYQCRRPKSEHRETP